MKPLHHERVVALSADDLDALLEAICLAATVGRDAYRVKAEAEHGRIIGIAEQLRGKFDL